MCINTTTGCAAFLANIGIQSDVTVIFNGKSFHLPAWSVSILPDCRNVVFNTAQVYLHLIIKWTLITVQGRILLITTLVNILLFFSFNFYTNIGMVSTFFACMTITKKIVTSFYNLINITLDSYKLFS